MAAITRSHTFTDGTTAYGSEVESEIGTIVTAFNNHNSGSSTWDVLSALSASSVPLTADNSSGTQNIMNLKDNGTIIFSVIDGGLLRAGLGTFGNPVYSCLTAATSGMYFPSTTTVGISANGTPILTATAAAATLPTTTLICSGTAIESSGSIFFKSDSYAQILSLDQTEYIQIRNAGISFVTNNGVTINGQLSITSSLEQTGNIFFKSNSFGQILSLDQTENLQIRDTGITFTTADGILVGAATGGAKGASTINAAGDIYKNNSAYANPDYALEHWATGKIEKFKNNEGASSYTGILPLDELINYCRTNFDLPRVKSIGSDETGGQGIFSRADAVLEKIEEAYLYIFQLHERIKTLESK